MELTSGTEALVSVWYAFSWLSVAIPPRLLSGIDSSTSCPLLSRFSIKNDDALDEVGAWLTVSFPFMIYRCRCSYAESQWILFWRCLNAGWSPCSHFKWRCCCAVLRRVVMAGIAISSVPTGGDGNLIDGSSSIAERQVERLMRGRHPGIGRAQ